MTNIAPLSPIMFKKLENFSKLDLNTFAAIMKQYYSEKENRNARLGKFCPKPKY